MLIDKKTCKTREYQRFCGRSGECAEMCGSCALLVKLQLFNQDTRNRFAAAAFQHFSLKTGPLGGADYQNTKPGRSILVIHQGKLRFYIRKNTKNAHHRFHPWYLPLRKPLIFKEKCQIIGCKNGFLVKLTRQFRRALRLEYPAFQVSHFLL